MDTARPIPRSPLWLSSLSLVGASVASIVTLLSDASFPSPTPPPPWNGALAEARGWAAVTLGIVVPTAAIAMARARAGSLSARVVWLGTLVYLVYAYLELAVSPPFTPLYLVYVVSFACAVPALVIALAATDVRAASDAFDERAPRRSIAAFAFVMAIGLTLAWTKDIFARTLAGDFGWPRGEAAIAHVVHALDLGLQVPLLLAAGTMQLLRRPGAHFVAGVMLVNAVCMGAALTGMVVMASVASGRSPVGAVPFAAVPLVALCLSVALFRALRRHEGRHEASPGILSRAP